MNIMNIIGTAGTDSNFSHKQEVKTSESQFSDVLQNVRKSTGQDTGRLIYSLAPCGYFELADEDDMIKYKDVTFLCDRKNNRLTLGDVSNNEDCNTVSLKKGGSLVFNRADTDDLLRALPMFDKEDQDRILEAIYKDKIARNTLEKSKFEEMDAVMKIAQGK